MNGFNYIVKQTKENDMNEKEATCTRNHFEIIDKLTRIQSYVTERRVPQLRSAQGAVILLIIVTIVLAVTTIRLTRESVIESKIRDLAEIGSLGHLNEELTDLVQFMHV